MMYTDAGYNFLHFGDTTEVKMANSVRMSITLSPELKATVTRDAKNKGISEAAVVRMRLKESYDSQARAASIAHGEPSPDPTGVPAQEA